MKKIKLLSIIMLCAFILCFSAFAQDFEKSRTYNNTFTDVPKDSWYAGSVAAVYEISLMEGVSEDTFDADSEISVAQAITIAARLHSIYNDTEIPEVSGGRWFQKYVSYCLDKKIITSNQFDSYSRSVLSYEMIELFAAALPKEFYPAINSISHVHDVPSSLDFYDDVMLFYNAGVLNGNDKFGTFLPMSAITRKRAAVILSRTAIKENRMKFTLEKNKTEFSAGDILTLIDLQTTKDTLDEIVLAAYDGCSITAAEYRYYSFISEGDNDKTENEIKFALAVEKYIKGMDLKVSAEDYEAILLSYYSPRTGNYGNTTYFDALDAMRLTDTAFAKLIALNKLNYLALNKDCTDITSDEVLEYANNNGYICTKNLFISKDSDDAYRRILEIQKYLSEGGSFDKLLKEHGEDPLMTGENSSYVFAKGWMEKPFEDAAFKLKVGSTSSVIETSLGYHIIKRVELNKNTLTSSNDYDAIAIKAGTAKFTDGIANIKDNMSLFYADNFEELSAILK